MPPKGTFKDRLEHLERTAPTEPPSSAREASGNSPRGVAKIIAFTLTESLTNADLSATASVTDFFDGVNPDVMGGGIPVYNRLTSQATYQYEGSSGATGYAFNGRGKYYIFDLECP